ncbi:nicotinamidase-related amidase [Paucibacter oligotrophus]|uniref:Nicotinamidase-related amidase n=1 Tax=Roseateles oligotrophus TaxID=1769250 RepID=A0A840LIV7_9BURK|nr:cysteine hydrolase family protein [Roseateles oligotrophus]MBB4845207.1 nicotinamidase-related amidase [Roseateles oligotrophus]
MTHTAPQPRTALLLIDVQMDYFPGGLFPLWQAEATLSRSLAAMQRARELGLPIVLVQHVADPAKGPAPFFNAGSTGVALHPAVLAAAGPEPLIVSKRFADSFEGTTLEATLSGLGVEALLVAGMMTQNCVVFTALSKAAEKYRVQILPDCCTTVSEMIHKIALSGVSTRVQLTPSEEALA